MELTNGARRTSVLGASEADRVGRWQASGTFPKKVVDGAHCPPYTPPHSSGAGLRDGLRFASLLVGSTGARNLKDREDRRVRLFDIVGLDEGTCGRRPGLLKPPGSGRSVKCKPFLNVTSIGLARWWKQMSSYANTPVCIFVQERLPEMPTARAYSAWAIGHQLESLILAQNERWRHA